MSFISKLSIQTTLVSMYAFGFIERQADGEQIIKRLRVQRIQEVRKQESVLVRQRCLTYREVIEEKKGLRRNALRLQKLKELQAAHDQLAKKWRKSLVDTGEAHRGAETIVYEAQEEVKVKEQEQKVMRAHLQQRTHEALQVVVRQAKTANATLNRQKEHRRAVLELQASNREDAHKAHEARLARIEAAEKKSKQLAASGGPIIIKQPPAGQSASSVRMQQTAPVAVQAQVMKHGATRADISVVKNEAVKESVVCYKRLFDMVIKDMQNRAKAKTRARVAVKTSASAKNHDELELEFNILHTVDRSGSRLQRVKSTSGVQPNEESPAIAQSFENIFLARQKAEMDALETVSNDSESVAETETSENVSDNRSEGADKKVGFAGSDSPSTNSAKITKDVSPTFGLEKAATKKVNPRGPSPPKVSFRSATNKPVLARPRKALVSSIPSAIISRPVAGASSGEFAPTIMKESLEIAKTSAVSEQFASRGLTFSKHTAIPEWGAAATPGWGVDAEDDTSVQFEITSEYATDEFSVGSGSKLSVSYAGSYAGGDLDKQSVDSLALDGDALQRQYIGGSITRAEMVEEVEITRRTLTAEPMHGFSRLSLDDALGELDVSFSSDDAHIPGMVSSKGRKANLSWVSETSDDRLERSASMESAGESSASTHTARHDGVDLADEDQDLQNSSGIQSSTESLGSSAYRTKPDGGDGFVDFGTYAGDGDEEDEAISVDYYSQLFAQQDDAAQRYAGEWNQRFGLESHSEASVSSSSSSMSSYSISHTHSSKSSLAEPTPVERVGRGSDENEEEDVQGPRSVKEVGAEEELLTVRLESAAGNVSTSASVSFESLFVEEDDEGEDEDESVGSSDEDSEADGLDYSEDEDVLFDEGSELEERDFDSEQLPYFGAKEEDPAANDMYAVGLSQVLTESAEPAHDFDADSTGEGLTLSDFVNKYANSPAGEALDRSRERTPAKSPEKAPLPSIRSSSDIKRESDESVYQRYQQRSKFMSSESLRSAHAARSVAGSSHHSQSLRELLGIGDSNDLVNIRKYTRGTSDSSGSDSGQDEVQQAPVAVGFGGRPRGIARSGISEISGDDLSDDDDEDVGRDLVKEIDEMKARLMNIMHVSGALSVSMAGGGSSMLRESKDSHDLSLSQHPLDERGFISGGSTSSGDSSLSHHPLEVGSEIFSKTSDNDEVFTKLDGLLGRALASSTTSSTMEGLVEQYLQSMSLSPHHLISRSIADDTLSGGNLSSLQTDGSMDAVSRDASRSMSNSSTRKSDDDDV